MKIQKSDNHKTAFDWKTVLGILAFALLMGVRDEFSQLWIRALLAGVAGGIFGATLWQLLQTPRK